jgi:hypothetical protein
VLKVKSQKPKVKNLVFTESFITFWLFSILLKFYLTLPIALTPKAVFFFLSIVLKPIIVSS